jgi:hypothetical protein
MKSYRLIIILTAALLFIASPHFLRAADAKVDISSFAPRDPNVVLRQIDLNVAIEQYEKVLVERYEARMQLETGPTETGLTDEQRKRWDLRARNKLEYLENTATELRLQIRSYVEEANKDAELIEKTKTEKEAKQKAAQCSPSEPKSPKAAEATPSFGPTIERTMNLFDAESPTVASETFIDFKTDRVATAPEAVLQEAQKQSDEGRKPDAVWNWVRREKLDAQAQLLYDQGVVTGVEFYGADMIVRQIPNAQWDGITPSEVSTEMNKWSEDEVWYPSMKATRFPTTYAFRTQAGGIGVLQIVSYNEESKTARVRYKLARSEAAKTPVAGKPAAGVVMPPTSP